MEFNSDFIYRLQSIMAEDEAYPPQTLFAPVMSQTLIL
jgi:hypothetical protein